MRTYRHRSSRYRRISPRTIRICLLLLSLTLLLNTIATRYSAEIESTLTLPASNIRFAVPTRVTIATPVATPTQLPVPTPKSLSVLPPGGILAQDTFQRASQAFWGVASDGQAWGGDAKSSQNFAIVNHTGQVTGGNGVYDAVLGPPVKDDEIVFSGSLTHYASSSLGAVLRWTDANSLYKVFLGGGQLILLKKVAGVVTVLKTVQFSAQDGKAYTFRCRAVGALLLARVWPIGQAEPSVWMLMVTDRDLVSGYGGVRMVIQNGTAATITSFMELSL
jgi:hypothetical protein